MILVIYLLGGLLTRASSMACYEGCFCYISTINCSNQSFTVVPYIPESFEANDIILAHNFISELNADEIPQHMEHLDLSYNSLKTCLLDLRKHSLESLNLSGNPLKHINLNSTILKILDLSYCDIRYLQAGFLDTMPTLETLNISHNPLKIIHPLSGNLKKLYIQDCRFLYISFDLPQLESLDVSYNKYMKGLSVKSNLTTLKASHGSLSHVDLALPKLQFLDMSHNKLNQVHCNNTSLEELDLSWNSLRNFSLVHVTLIKLDLSHNSLHELELTITELSYLNVSFNPLRKLHVSSENLELVDCASCRLEYYNISVVHTLNLSRNNLEVFIGEATILDLSHNLLNAYVGKAKIVDLRGNRLSLPNKVLLKGIAKLDNNPWLCKCEDTALKELYMKAIDQVSCASPEGKTWDSCYTTKLPKYMKDYPWVPLVSSGVLTVFIVIGIYAVKNKLWGIRSSQAIQPSTYDVEEERVPVRERVEDRLPSYEEALLMNKPNYNNRRSYEIVPNRRSSSSSI